MSDQPNVAFADAERLRGLGDAPQDVGVVHHLDAGLLRALAVEVVIVHVGHEQRVARGRNNDGGMSESGPMRRAVFEAVEERRIVVAEIEDVAGARARDPLASESDGTGQAGGGHAVGKRFSAVAEFRA